MKRLISLSAIIFCSIFAINAQENIITNNQKNDSVDVKIEVEKGIKGKVYVNFIVRPNGRIDSVHIAKSTNPELDKEAIRLVKELDSWKYRQAYSKKVSSYYTLPITFMIEDDYNKPSKKSKKQNRKSK